MSSPTRVPYSQPNLTVKFLRAHRLSQGLSQKQLAKRAGINRRAITNLELGRAARISTCAKIAIALGTTLQALRRDDPLSRPPIAIA